MQHTGVVFETHFQRVITAHFSVHVDCNNRVNSITSVMILYRTAQCVLQNFRVQSLFLLFCTIQFSFRQIKEIQKRLNFVFLNAADTVVMDVAPPCGYGNDFA